MKKIVFQSVITLFIVILYACSSNNKKDTSQLSKQKNTNLNPPAVGFDSIGSDKKAMEIADKVMQKMGGRKAWDNTKILKWNFFGRRTLWWNKWNGDVKIKMGERDSNILLVNINTLKGKIKLDGVEITQPDSIKKYTAIAKSIWINDSYWLFMPFKLKDSKTTLKYLGIDTTKEGVYSYKLSLTFNNIGDTPENKYYIDVDTAKLLVNQWSYFNQKQDTLPAFTTIWGNYKKYGTIFLSGDRGKSKITDIAVLDSLPINFFNSF